MQRAWRAHNFNPMSRAFVKETAESAAPPERMVEDGPNPVTPEGLAQIEAEVARLEASLKAETNPLLRETLERDLRYWRHQKSTAQVVDRRPLRPAAKARLAANTLPLSPPADAGEEKKRDAANHSPLTTGEEKKSAPANASPTDASEENIVSFGATVTLRRKGREQTIRLVGVDEADPKRALISIRSPLAQAILGLRAGDIAEASEPLGEIEVVRIE